MHVKLAGVRPRVRSVETDDIEIPVFHPHPSDEPARARVLLRRNVDDPRTHIAEEFTFDELEIVVRAVELPAVDQDNLSEAARQIFRRKEMCEHIERAGLRTALLN